MIEIMHLNMTLCCKKCQFISWAHNLHHRIMINLFFLFLFFVRTYLDHTPKTMKTNIKVKKTKNTG